MAMDRRDFIAGAFSYGILSSTSLSTLALASRIYAKSQLAGRYILAPLDAMHAPKAYLGKLPPGVVVIATNIETGITTAFQGIEGLHSILPLASRNQAKVALIPKHSKVAAIVDLDEPNSITYFKASTGLNFYGHASLSHDGQYLFCSESAINLAEGTITIRDVRSGKVIDKFASSGQNPHEILLLPDGSTLLVANAGPLDFDTKRDGAEKSCMAMISTMSGKPKNKLISKLPNTKLAHFTRLPSGRLFVGGVPGTNKESTPGQVVTSNGSEDLIPLPYPSDLLKNLINETLSVVASHELNLAAVSMPYSNKVIAWNVSDLSFKFATEVKHPTGLAFINNKMVIGAGDGEWVEINPKDGIVIPQSLPRGLAGNQTHISLAKF